MEFELKSVRHLARGYMEQILRPGDGVVDATMGNGHDTLMLAQLVGAQGCVWAFDIQAQAIENTRRRLEAEGLLGQTRLFHAGHEQMARYVKGPVRGVMFNLGWLPGGDKQVTTRADSTMIAVRAALDLIMPLGVVSICAYPGHDEGEKELARLVAFLSALDVHEYSVLRHGFINHPNHPPELLLVQRNGSPETKGPLRPDMTPGSFCEKSNKIP